jgi:hypothetical protein
MDADKIKTKFDYLWDMNCEAICVYLRVSVPKKCYAKEIGIRHIITEV